MKAPICPDDKVRRYFVYLKYWTLNLRHLMVYPKVLFPPSFIIEAHLQFCSTTALAQWPSRSAQRAKSREGNNCFWARNPFESRFGKRPQEQTWGWGGSAAFFGPAYGPDSLEEAGEF